MPFCDRHATQRVTVTLFAVLLVGCYGANGGTNGEAGGPRDSGPISSEDFAEALADARCTPVRDCCNSQGFDYDISVCRERFLAMGESVTDAPWAGVEWDPDAARACVDEIWRSGSECTGFNDLTSPCNRLYRGIVPEGEACEGTVECAPIDGQDAQCVLSPSTSETGTCSRGRVDVTKRAQLGEDCRAGCAGDLDSCVYVEYTGTDAICELSDGLVCGEDHKCAPAPRVGEACSSYCELGAYCEYTGSRTCMPRKAEGDACSSDDECADAPCLDNICRLPPPVNAFICGG